MPIINMTLTKVGYRAQLGSVPQIRMRISRIAVTNFAGNYVPSVNQVALQGPELWSTKNVKRQLNDRFDMVFKINIPDSAPGTPSSPVSFHEVGIFVEDQKGQEHLFAIGLFSPPYVKDRDFQLLVVCYLRAPTQGFSVEFEANELADLPVYNMYGDLIPANQSGPNLVIVRQARPSLCGGAALVCKVANGDQWGIVNGSKLFTGYAGIQDSPTKLIIPDLNAASLENKDLCMVTIVSGTGVHQTRMLRTDFSVDSPYSILPDKSSRVIVWAGPGCC